MTTITETPEQLIAREAQECHDLHSALLTALQRGREAMWETARCLYELRNRAAWAVLGYDSCDEWLADPALGLSKSTFNRLAYVWERLVAQRQIEPAQLAKLDTSKVALVLPQLEAGKVQEDDALADVEALGWRDLREKYVEQPEELSPSAGTPSASEPGAEDDPELAVGEMLDPEDDALTRAREDIAAALASGAERPRVRRETLEVCEQLLHDAGAGDGRR